MRGYDRKNCYRLTPTLKFEWVSKRSIIFVYLTVKYKRIFIKSLMFITYKFIEVNIVKILNCADVFYDL